MTNDFSKLDAQDGESRLAQVQPNETTSDEAFLPVGCLTNDGKLVTRQHAKLPVQKYVIAEGPLYGIRGGEGGELAVFDCYVVAVTTQGMFISNDLYVKGDGGTDEYGFRIPNHGYKEDCKQMLALLVNATEIDPSKWARLPALPTLEQSLAAEYEIEDAQRHGHIEPNFPYWLYTIREDVCIQPVES